jgi:hypothetical protein
MFVLSVLAIFRDNKVKEVIRSDGRGYYAYLPAIILYNGSYERLIEAEYEYFKESQMYLYKDKNGHLTNKYFPGLALLQVPFFDAACVISWLINSPIDGYSSIFQYCFYFGSLFYALAGLFLFLKVLKLIYPERKKGIQWLVPALYLSTTLIFYSFDTPSFSHLYSFFLFGLFSFLVLKLGELQSSKVFFLLGMILGLIVLVRPTNGLVVLIIPFLLVSQVRLKSFFTALFKNKAKYFWFGLGGFILIISLLLMIWKLQSGSWILWPYSGEGFNFLNPKVFASLFSFRNGLFLHSPVLILSFIGAFQIFRRNKYQAITWAIYFTFNFWVITAWWCWDYESPYGSRALTEHLFFLLIPAVYFCLHSAKKVVVTVLIIFCVLGGIRYWEITSDFMVDQRFTRSNYLTSLQFWSSKNKGRWNFTRSAVPHGKMIRKEVLLENEFIQKVTAEEPFVCTVEKPLLKPRTNERLYYRVKIDKRQFEESFGGVYLVIDAFRKDQNKRFYQAVALFNDRLEGKDNWAQLEFEGQVYDNFQEFDFIKIYIWNQGKKVFEIKNIEFSLEVYKS